MKEEPRRNLSPEAIKLLEIIISNEITEINYDHPKRTLARYVSKELAKKEDYKALLEEISGGEFGGRVMRARVGFTLFGYEFGTRYIIDLDRARQLYDGQEKRIKDSNAETKLQVNNQ